MAHPRQPKIATMQQLQFTLTREFIPLCDLLKATGVADSGGMGKAMVADGLVKVDGQVELRKTCKIRADQIVELGDVRIHVLPIEA
jgi:ribosome-associated protein